MQILALESTVSGTRDDRFAPHLKAEALRVWELQQQGIIREIWFRTDKTEAVLLLECDSVEAARATLNTLPLVEQNLITFDLLPLKPYPGFARLFEQR